MPVISCPDCGRDVSTLATSCPHCGRPSPAGTTPMHAAPAPLAREETLWTGSPSRILLAGHIIGIVVVIVAVPLFASFFTIPFGWAATAAIVLVQLIALTISWLKLRS